MADTTAELIDVMRDMRVRNAILVTALERLGGSIDVTHDDAYEAAKWNIRVERHKTKLRVSLEPVKC